jgi:hypothetical protein
MRSFAIAGSSHPYPAATNVTLSDTVTLVTLQAQHKTVPYL